MKAPGLPQVFNQVLTSIPPTLLVESFPSEAGGYSVQLLILDKYTEVREVAIVNLEVREVEIGNLEIREVEIVNLEVREVAIGNLEIREVEIGNLEIREVER